MQADGSLAGPADPVGDPAVAARLRRAMGEFGDLEAQLADPELGADPARLRRLSIRYHELQPLAATIKALDGIQHDLRTAEEVVAASSGDERRDWSAEVDRLRVERERLAAEVRELLVPPDPNAGKAVIVEIRGAEGGEEANLFARDLYAMYLAYAARRRWDTETLTVDESPLGGLNQVTFVVRGGDAWRRLKYEGGPHRVQRVPVTESQGRIHTSSATVAILAEADEIDVQIDERDLQIDVYRSSGPGGQSVNTTDSAVRITHVPSGLVVAVQDERSQLQNRQRALQLLRARLYERAQRERDEEISADRRSQVGGGGRSEKIRTYNFKENRVTDHRIGLSLYRLGDVLAGDLDEIVDALAADERARQLSEPGP